MVLQADDAALLKFAQDHQRTPPFRANAYNFGRSVNEVLFTIVIMTGHEYGDVKLQYLHPGGFPNQIKLKRELFQRHASEWSEWWAPAKEQKVRNPFH